MDGSLMRDNEFIFCDYCEKEIKPGETVTNVGDSFTVIIACSKCAEPRLQNG